jgi:hypothetical protein
MPMKKVKLLDLGLIRRLGGFEQTFEAAQADELIKQGRAEEIGAIMAPSVEQATKTKIDEQFDEENEFIFPNELIAMG